MLRHKGDTCSLHFRDFRPGVKSSIRQWNEAQSRHEAVFCWTDLPGSHFKPTPLEDTVSLNWTYPSMASGLQQSNLVGCHYSIITKSTAAFAQYCDTVILKPPEDDTWQVANTHLQSWWVPRRHVCLCGKRHWSPGKEQMGAFAAFLPHTLPLTLPGGSITAHNKHPVFGSEAQEVSVYCCSACVSGPPHHVGKPKAGMRL